MGAVICEIIAVLTTAGPSKSLDHTSWSGLEQALFDFIQAIK